MSIPRFSVRTLMIAVAIAGLECWAVVAIDWLAAALILGPLVGIGNECRRRQARPWGYARSGALGGLAVVAFSLPMLIISIIDLFYHSWFLMPDLIVGVVIHLAIVPLAGAAIGAALGLVAEAASLLVFFATLPWKPAPSLPANPPDVD